MQNNISNKNITQLHPLQRPNMSVVPEKIGNGSQLKIQTHRHLSIVMGARIAHK